MKKKAIILAISVAVTFYAATAATVAGNTISCSTIVVAAAPPAAVLQSFATLFGNVPVKEWKLRSNGDWRAHFTRNGRAWEATFTSTGILVKSEPK